MFFDILDAPDCCVRDERRSKAYRTLVANILTIKSTFSYFCSKCEFIIVFVVNLVGFR